MTKPWFHIIGLAVSIGLISSFVGCKTTAKPNLLHPGSAQVQQARALRYDPYPDPDIGPAMDGSRPRNYDKPIPEPARARWELGQWK